jgi:hypothetical protein
MEKNNNYTYIITQEELKKHLNELIVCYYYTDYIKESMSNIFDPDNKMRTVQFKWMFILKGIKNNTYNNNNTTVRHVTLESLNAIRLLSQLNVNGHMRIDDKPIIMYKNHMKPTESSAQSYVRLPTKEEKLIYLKLMRKRRIYGHD